MTVGSGGEQNLALAAFEAQRPRLTGIAYRILGSADDAQDAVQDAWLRWAAVSDGAVRNAEALLTTIVTRLSVDRLRREKARREAYTGEWLAVPLRAQGDPEGAAELADSLSLAMLVVLETLSPLERAAFILHEVFDHPYAEVSTALDRSEASVRQLVHRARVRVQDGAARYDADPAQHAQVVAQFLAACQSADSGALLEVMAPDVVLHSDGGGVAQAPLRPIHGSDKVGRLMQSIAARLPEGVSFGLESFNGALGIVARLDGTPISAMAVSVRDGRVESLHLVANPAKMTQLASGITISML
jgi:RNA polymerase sigma-70 factor, ECF subfamily